ncbi:MAG: hypothetical protein WA776_03040 [Xanthobacteraceae bacterium]
MKIGIVGTGTVGCACAMAAVNRGTARNIEVLQPDMSDAEREGLRKSAKTMKDAPHAVREAA